MDPQLKLLFFGWGLIRFGFKVSLGPRNKSMTPYGVGVGRFGFGRNRNPRLAV